MKNRRITAICLVLIAIALLWLPAGAEGEGSVYYEVFLRAFADSDGDGIGDLPGLTAKLDYLEDLGISGLWLMPLFPATSYHGYDVTNYTAIHPDFGTLEDFETLLSAAHEKGIKVLLDIPLNHTGKAHPWFRENPEYYVWAEDQTGRDISLSQKVWDGNVWIPYGGKHYYAIFWDGMPDLNYENSALRQEVKEIAKYWLDMGVDGFRLDATSHIYGLGEYASAQNVEDSAKWWQEFNSYCKSINPDCFLLGEAWEPLEKRAALLSGLDAVVNFDVGEAIIPLIKSGGSGPYYVNNLVKIYEAYGEANPGYVDAPFLTNHDQNRVCLALGSKPERAKMAANMLLTLPGTVFIYYGEEIGMGGAKPDEELRTPFLWGGDDPMETSWHDSKYNKRTIPLAEQQADPDSLWHHYKSMIALREQYPALSEGRLSPADVENKIVAAYTLETDNQRVLVIHNFTAAEQQTTYGALAPYTSLIQEIP